MKNTLGTLLSELKAVKYPFTLDIQNFADGEGEGTEGAAEHSETVTEPTVTYTAKSADGSEINFGSEAALNAYNAVLQQKDAAVKGMNEAQRKASQINKPADKPAEQPKVAEDSEYKVAQQMQIANSKKQVISEITSELENEFGKEGAKIVLKHIPGLKDQKLTQLASLDVKALKQMASGKVLTEGTEEENKVFLKSYASVNAKFAATLGAKEQVKQAMDEVKQVKENPSAPVDKPNPTGTDATAVSEKADYSKATSQAEKDKIFNDRIKARMAEITK